MLKFLLSYLLLLVPMFALADTAKQTAVRVADPAVQILIDELGLRREDPEPMEQGVPHPATYVIDREGVIRFADVRTDFHIWVDSEFAREAIAALP